MNVGWVGLGKLGLPCAVALDAAGHDVVGFDVSEAPRRHLTERSVPYREEGLDELLAGHGVKVASSIADVVAHAEVVFVAVQTPHHPGFDGTKPAPAERRDFEYGHLISAVREVCAEANTQERPIVVVVVSTVLPGTFARALRPLQSMWARLVYNPFFIAMGTTVADFVRPEFVLVGNDGDDMPYLQLARVYAAVHDRPIRVVSIESAELAKVAYNVFLSVKIVFANYIAEICHKTGADADEVTGSLALATDRIVSPRYMTAGMGDGGGCHPRDLIALSWLAERLDLSHDLADDLMAAREAHSGWLASLVAEWHHLTGLPVVVLGRSYKPETNLTLGSPARLLEWQLTHEQRLEVEVWDPHVDDDQPPLHIPSVFVVATRHDAFAGLLIPAGSVVVDPFGYMPERASVTTIRVGRK